MKQHSRMLGAILLISGTTIGAGMLALPVSTGLAGFFPTIILFFFYWGFMTYTAFLMLEVNLWFGENINLFTMVKNTLGRTGEMISCAAYLLLLYLLTTAYLAGSGPIIADFIYAITGLTLPTWAGALPLLLIFGFFVYVGAKYVDYVNRFLMLGLVIAYFGMVVFITPHVEEKLLRQVEWKNVFLSTSLIATSFGFHIIIPTLTTYLHHDVKQLRKAIFIGSIIPLMVYVLWEFFTLGVIPLEGAHGIYEGYAAGTNGVELIRDILQNPFIGLIAQCFSFFAIVTSFLGVTLSLTDFLADGLSIKKTPTGRVALFILTFVPPLIFIFTYPRAFLGALEYAGAFGVIVLLAILPTWMVWEGRYRKHYESTFKVPGGKIALVLVMVFSFMVIAVEIANMAGIVGLVR